MAGKVKFLKDHKDYGSEFKKDDIRQVSSFIQKTLLEKGIAEDCIEPTKTPKKEIKKD